MQFLKHIDLTGNQIQNVVLHKVDFLEDITDPILGQIVYENDSERAYVCSQINPILEWTGMDAFDAEWTATDIVASINAAGSSVIINNEHLEITTESQTENKIFASPDATSGSPTFRALTINDLPSLTSLQLASKVTDETGSGKLVFDTNPNLTNPKVNTIFDANNNEILILESKASAVNEVTISNAATGAKPAIKATGSDDNISLLLAPKGNGRVEVQTVPQGDSTNTIATTAFVNAEIAADATPITHVGSGDGQHALVTPLVHGFMSSIDKSKLDGIATGAEVNQNAFSYIAVNGQTTVSADLKTDTLTLVGGSNMTIITDSINDSITFNSVDTNTTYSVKTSVQIGGAGIDLDAGGSGSGTDTVTIKGLDGSTVSRFDENTITVTSHNQNTDTGTTSQTFTLDSNNLGAGRNTSLYFNRGTDAGSDAALTWNEGTDTFELSNGITYGDLKVGNLNVQGTLTTIHSTEVNIGDSEILLNANITQSAENSDGGIAIKRLMADNTTRKDAKINYNNVTNRWETTFGTVTGNLVVAPVANKVVANILPDGVNNIFIIEHFLNTRDLSVMIRETDSYNMVFTDVQFTNLNSLLVTFKNIPTVPYTVTIIG